MLTDEQRHYLEIILSDFPTYAESFLKIRAKDGTIKDFKLNKAQLYIHGCLEQQIAETGMVRAVILKGRQQGCSTLIGARFFYKTITQPGKRTYILTHEQAATDNLFGMVNRYYEHYPDWLKPTLGASNAKELSFSEMDSGYKVATAGNKGAGRSDTAQYVHSSEAAFWPNAEDHLAGILQTVPLAAGTEIIFESTAKGIGNVFHDIWEKGVARKGGWLAIFIPWHWQEEYRTRGVEIDNEDREYGAIHGLDEEQMMWRRYKIDELGSEALFKQEYPTTAAEAFEISSEMSFMDSIPVAKARKAEGVLSDGVTILGVDPARKGLDKTVVTLRRGRVAEVVSRVNGDDTMATVGSVLKLIAKYRPNAVFCDIGGIGAGIVDRLRELGHKNVRGVDFGSSPMNKKLYVNKRNEMWGLMKEWILSEGGVKIPDSDSLQIDLCGILIARYDSHNRAILESKDEFRKRFKRSPDEGDSLALTFAYPVVDYEAEGLQMRAYGEAAEYFEGDRVTVPGMGY